MLRLAAEQADVVAINVNLRAGVIDERAFPDGTPEATDRKLGWIREAAGDRASTSSSCRSAGAPRHGHRRPALRVIEELAPGLRAHPGAGRAPRPTRSIGTVDQICDQLVERRERWGISYLGMSGDQLDAFAPSWPGWPAPDGLA